MPAFWRFGVDQDGDDQIKAISAYLWQESFDGKLAEQARGDTARGKDLFETRGCLACHSIGEPDSAVGGHFAANLQKVGEKANYDSSCAGFTTARALGPIVPKKTGPDAGDYSQHNQPYVSTLN